MNQSVHTAARTKSKPKAKVTRTRRNDPARTMAEILHVATAEFADKGLAGARIDAIADATRTSKRMIYYYYGSKEGLYLAVIEEAYRHTRSIESGLHLSDLAPREALEKLVSFTYDRHRENEDFIRLVMSENILRGEYIRQSKDIKKVNLPVITAISELYGRGVAGGVFRPGLDPIEIHGLISALAFFNVSNRHTFGAIFQKKADQGLAHAIGKEAVIDMVLRYVLRQP
jgi:AcrR family transcriptional regulator